eukprot:CAMPEP_0118835042 /NCGR_PEP_ID=MMETSP1162-20130426/52566_1 /TAXON_ID=33656 /ORGANISM="Phaeocystis Sp, Strain CCMP2710" /LENGTH=81 /DNA_ID=CAMNT_0006766787 /DNA_START=39 /DNA_END=280 /DNA_ORIENTATION=-
MEEAEQVEAGRAVPCVDEDAIEHLAVAGEDVEGRHQPLVLRGAQYDALDLPVVLEEPGLISRDLRRPAPLGRELRVRPAGA